MMSISPVAAQLPLLEFDGNIQNAAQSPNPTGN